MHLILLGRCLYFITARKTWVDVWFIHLKIEIALRLQRNTEQYVARLVAWHGRQQFLHAEFVRYCKFVWALRVSLVWGYDLVCIKCRLLILLGSAAEFGVGVGANRLWPDGHRILKHFVFVAEFYWLVFVDGYDRYRVLNAVVNLRWYNLQGILNSHLAVKRRAREALQVNRSYRFRQFWICFFEELNHVFLRHLDCPVKKNVLDSVVNQVLVLWIHDFPFFEAFDLVLLGAGKSNTDAECKWPECANHWLILHVADLVEFWVQRRLQWMDEEERLRYNRERILQHFDVDWLVWVAKWVVKFAIINLLSIWIRALER